MSDELTRFYARFDAAVAHLPPHIRAEVHETRTHETDAGMAFRDADGRPLACVLADGTVHERQTLEQATKAKRRTLEHDTLRDLTKIVSVLLRRIDALERGRKDLSGITARIAKLEESAEGQIRYRGYWRDGASARPGDAYTHDGSLWRANRNTDDRPMSESGDWALIVRKGRDAK